MPRPSGRINVRGDGLRLIGPRKLVPLSNTPNRLGKRRMFGNVGDALPVKIDRPPIPQTLDVLIPASQTQPVRRNKRLQ